MLGKNVEPAEVREILLSLLSTSGTLAGFSIGLMSVASLRSVNRITTFADDLFLLSGVGFLAVVYLVFFALRRVKKDRLLAWAWIIDATFLASLTLVVVAGFLVLYEFLL